MYPHTCLYNGLRRSTSHGHFVLLVSDFCLLGHTAPSRILTALLFMGRLASVLVSQQVVDLWAHSLHRSPNVKSTASKNHRFSFVGRLIHEAQELRVKWLRDLQRPPSARAHNHDRREETNDFLYSGCSLFPSPSTADLASRHIYSCLRKPVTSQLDLGHSILD